MHRPFRFTPPPAGPRAVLRPRLLDVLARRSAVRLITVEAGAGLGKTTLLVHATTPGPGAGARDYWLTCAPGDSSASSLIAGLLEALGAEVPDSPRAEHVVDATWSLAPEQVCFIIDDVHHVEPGSAGERALCDLVEGLPENAHVVLSGRRLPPIARARLLLHERAAEISQREMHLDAEESEAFAATHGVDPDVIRRAEGWPALAELYARAGSGDAERFVWEEVVAFLPDTERDAFLLLCAVGGAEADLLDHVAGGPFDRKAIRDLPLVATDDQGGLWPHGLWDELVRRRVDPSVVNEAAQRLVAALLERGENVRAFELLSTTGDWDHALPVLFQACNDQRHPPWRDQMERWRTLVPDHFATTPEAVYLDAMIERATDPWSPNALKQFKAAMVAFRDRRQLANELGAGIRASYVAWIVGDNATLETMVTRNEELLANGVRLGALAATTSAVLADLAGRSDEVRSLLAGIGPLEPRLSHFPGIMRTFAALADGDAASAVADAAETAEAAKAIAPAAMSGWSALMPTLVAWAMGDLDRALADPPVDLGGRFIVSERVPTIALGAVIAAHLGDVDRAKTLLGDIDALVPELGNRDLLAAFRGIAAAAVCAADRDEDGAREALREALDGRDLAPAGAGRAVRWLPSLPYLFHDGCRELLDGLPSAGSRRRQLDACRALLDLRAGRAAATLLPDDPSVLLTILPAALAVELLVRMTDGRPAAMHAGYLASLVDRAPDGARSGLRRLLESEDEAVVRAARSLLATVPIPPPSHVRIEVFGPARLLRDGVPVDAPEWRRQRVRQLVCAVVAHREIRRARLGALLWPDFDEKAVSANLRMTLSYVQGLLEENRARGDAPWFLQQHGGVLRLRPGDHLSVDAWEFESALDAAERSGTTPSLELGHLLRAVACWRGEYLEDAAGEEWAEPMRERVRQRFLRACVRAGDLLVAAGRAAEAVDLADRALAVDPWCEPAIRLQVRAHLARGDRGSAERAFEVGRRSMAELGVTLETDLLDR